MSLMKSHFLSYKKLDKFQAEKFLYQGTFWQKIQAAVSFKLVSYMPSVSKLFHLKI